MWLRQFCLGYRSHPAGQTPQGVCLTAQSAAANDCQGDNSVVSDVAESVGPPMRRFRSSLRWLSAEGVSLNKLSKLTRHVRPIVLHDTWMLNSWPALEDNRSNSTGVVIAVGYESVPDQSTFRRVSQSLEEEGMREAIRNAAVRAVHAEFRNSVPTPESVVRAHGRDFSPILAEQEIDRVTRRAAIRNWIRLLLNDVHEVRPLFTHVTRSFVEIAAEIGFYQDEYDYALSQRGPGFESLTEHFHPVPFLRFHYQ